MNLTVSERANSWLCQPQFKNKSYLIGPIVFLISSLFIAHRQSLNLNKNITIIKISQIPEDHEIEEITDGDKKKETSLSLKNWKKIAKESVIKTTSTLQRTNLQNLIKIAPYFSDYTSDEFNMLRYLHKKTGSLQAVLVFKTERNCLNVKLLASHPSNICKSNSISCEKAGVLLIHALFRKCLQEKKDSLKLIPIRGSQLFYEKLGFTKLPNGDMLICKEKIISLMSNKM